MSVEGARADRNHVADARVEHAVVGAFGAGLGGLVEPITKPYNAAVEELQASQRALLTQLQSVRDALEETSRAEFPDEDLVRVQDRVESLRRRVANVNLALSTIRDRAERIHSAAVARHGAALAAASKTD